MRPASDGTGGTMTESPCSVQEGSNPRNRAKDWLAEKMEKNRQSPLQLDDPIVNRFGKKNQVPDGALLE